MKITTSFLFLALSASLTLISCEKKGPAEKAGEKVDEAIKAVGDAVDPKGPGEKVGEAIDKAVDKATN
ncbi:MAG: antitoxin [Verrucomicrobiales bacterium]|nr:antitoxin [Verrucomicrobiales bacterium]